MYGMTEEDTPTPTPAAERPRIAERGRGGAAGERRDDHRRDHHRSGEAVDAAQAGVLGDAVGKDDVEREEDGVRDREGHAERSQPSCTPVRR